MPKKEGIETIMEFRRDFKDVKVIAMRCKNPFHFGHFTGVTPFNKYSFVHFYFFPS
jgi:hypothetical protein